MSAVISVQGLEKSFGRTRALDGLDLEVSPGEVHGYLGPSGAGKMVVAGPLIAAGFAGLQRRDLG